MKKFVLVVILAAFAMTGIANISYAKTKKSTPAKEKVADMKSADDLKMAMRKLWEDHMTNMRNYFTVALGDSGDTDKNAAIKTVLESLLKNQDDIVNAIKPYYGDEIGKNLAALLRDHILIAEEVVKAAKTGNKEDWVNARQKWYDNADDIATYLNGINPNWPKKLMVDMLWKHTDLAAMEVESLAKKDVAADKDAYDKGHEHILLLADTLSDGIVKQFPSKFKK